MDHTGKIVREVKVASEPEALLGVLTNPAYRLKRIGLEAGSLSQWPKAIKSVQFLKLFGSPRYVSRKPM